MKAIANNSKLGLDDDGALENFVFDSFLRVGEDDPWNGDGPSIDGALLFTLPTQPAPLQLPSGPAVGFTR